MTAEQDRVADPAVSAWVAASAGTGKTHVLTNRVLRLLLSGARPGGILCLTFTKAAAAEMANRINDRLAEWATLPDDGLAESLKLLTGAKPDAHARGIARRLFAQVLDVPGGLKIQTIHAFCQSLMGRFPLEAGVAPHAAIMDERSADDLRHEAVNRVLARASGGRDPALADALAFVSAEATDVKFPDLIKAVTGERQALQQATADAIHQTLGVDENAGPDAILQAACADTVFDVPALRHAAEALAGGSKTDKERGATIATWLAADPATRAGQFDAYRGAFLTASSGYTAQRASLGTKPIQNNHPDAIETLMAEAERLIEAGNRMKLAFVARASRALLLLGKAIEATYGTLKDQRAVLDYDDLIHRARALVADPDSAAWVLYKLDEGLEHILVDEAQDTNPDQWAVIEALAYEFFTGIGTHDEPRTVFAVGDAKQSIYSFQRADPAEFERTRAEFGRRVRAAEQRFIDGLLDMSFRSTEAVLKLVDTVFENDTALNGMRFSAQEPTIAHKAKRAGVAGLVELWEPEQPEDIDLPEGWEPPVTRLDITDPAVRLAKRIAGQIEHWLNNRTMLDSKDRPIRAGDVLILVRRRNEFFQAMVRELKQRDIPVAGVDRMILTDQLAVMDLLALGQVALMPEDDLTLASVLKSPLVGLEEDELFALAHGRPGSLWQALGEKKRDNARFADAHAFLEQCLSRADYVPPFEFFSTVLDQGRRVAMLARLGPDALDPMDELLALALDYERNHAPSLQGFIHWIGATPTEVKREMEQAKGEVRVMTVHGAKGLQAPIVFLPDTCGAPSQPPDLYWRDSGDGTPALLWPVSAANRVGAVAEAHEAATRLRDEEYNRQLYVALTRAADRLYVCGYDGKNARKDHCWYNLIADGFDRLNAQETEDFLGNPVRRHASGDQNDAKKEEAKAQPTATEPPAWLRAPAPPEPRPSRPLAPSRPSQPDMPVRSPLEAEDRHRFLRGNLIHRLLQFLPDLAPEARQAAGKRFLGQPAYALDLDTIDDWYGEVARILDDPVFGPLFGPDSAAEVPVTGLVGADAVSGQIDRLAVTDTDVLIVDYKTNRPPPTRPESVPALYLRQMAAYRALIAQVYPGRAVRCALLWTDAPVLMELAGTLLDTHADALTTT